MQVVNHHFNPFSTRFRESVQSFQTLPLSRKVAAVALAVFGALMTFYLLCVGGIALFQLSVRWLKTSEGVEKADPVQQVKVKIVQTREERVDELKRIMQLSAEERRREAEKRGYRILTDDNLSGYTGKGYHEDNSYVYQGEFVDGRRHGVGTTIYFDSFGERPLYVYCGEVVNGRHTGNNLHVHVNGEIYEGNTDEEKLRGNGFYSRGIDGFMMSIQGNFEKQDALNESNPYNGKISCSEQSKYCFEGQGIGNIFFCYGFAFKGSGKLTVQSEMQVRCDDGIDTPFDEKWIAFDGNLTATCQFGRIEFKGDGVFIQSDGRREQGKLDLKVPLDL